jgi:hypothetical protein
LTLATTHYEVKPGIIKLVETNPFRGLEDDNSYRHIKEFTMICNTVQQEGVPAAWFKWNLKDRYGEPEGGSEWEPIKILLEGDGYSNKTNTASNTCLRLTTQVGQVHTATGVLLNLGTNFQPHRPENAAEHQNSSPLTFTGQTGEHHRSDRSLLVELGNFHRMAPHRSGLYNTPVRPVSARKPQNTKQVYRAPN